MISLIASCVTGSKTPQSNHKSCQEFLGLYYVHIMRIMCLWIFGVLIMNITLGKEFERRITEKVAAGLYTSASEVIRDGLRLLFEKDVARNQQLEILREEVAKGFEQLADGELSNSSVMDIFEQASLASDNKPISKATNVEL